MAASHESGFSLAEGGVIAAQGFTCAGVHCGLKKSGRRDLALIVAEKPVPAAAVFTTNAVAAAPVLLSRSHIAMGVCRAVVINAGNANACTGDQGMRDAMSMAEATAASLGCEATDVVVCSTGVIGVPLATDLVTQGIAQAADDLDAVSGDAVAEAIMTTDTFPKQSAVGLELGGHRYLVGGVAKGSGMIAPNMATMLSVVTTDLPLTSEACHAALSLAAQATFNRVTVDSDTSTNDTLVLMASGAGGGDEIGPDDERFEGAAAAIRTVCGELARMLARDGEGATKLVTVTVHGAFDEQDAEKAARAVADSPLVKTALFGRDANWGRVAMAVGKSGAKLDVSKLRIVLAGILTCEAGTAVAFDEAAALEALSAAEVDIEVWLGTGEASATVLTCDLSYDYVRINGDYRS